MSNEIFQVLVFAECFERESPYGEGVKHFDLRRLVRLLGPLKEVLEFIDCGDKDLVEEFILQRQLDAIEIIDNVDRQLNTPPKSSKELVQQAFEDRVSEALDEILTASVLRIPRDLHQRSVQARVLRAQHEASYRSWQEARQSIFAVQRKLEVVVADLAHAYRKRSALIDPTQKSKDAFAQVQTYKDSLAQCETRCQQIEEELGKLHEKTFSLIEIARSVIARINRLQIALSTLMIKPSQNVHDQMCEQTDRLGEMLDHVRDDFSSLQRLERDPTFVDVINEIAKLESTAHQILTPIRPSVFAQPLDRREELRRLALIALCIYTDRQDTFNPKARHGGVGRAATGEVLVLADLIDKTESEQVYESVFTFQTPDGEKLAIKERRGRWWYYKITQTGMDQAYVWLSETIDPRALKQRIQNGIAQRRIQKKDSFTTSRDMAAHS